jgi:hypothetical protein
VTIRSQYFDFSFGTSGNILLGTGIEYWRLGFTVFRLLTDFVCLYNYEFWLSLCKIARSSVILLLSLFLFALETNIDRKKIWHFCWLSYLYTFSQYENPSLIIFSAKTEYISTIYLFCSSIVINTIIVTARNFEP